MMMAMNRRTFLNDTKKMGLSLAAGWTLLTDPRSVRATPANDNVVLGFIGAGGRNTFVLKEFMTRGDCHVGWIADVNLPRADELAAFVAQEYRVQKPKTTQDFRTVLDDGSVDAVIIATPDHWHAAATIWACQAGKDVYVEKPTSHSPWEGRKMVEAARKYQRIVQVGTQTLSAPYFHTAKEYIDQGKLGKIHFCRVYTMRLWPNVPLAADSDPPAGLDWDMWNGPAPQQPYNSTLHSYWHHFWRYSGGDIINNGIHSIDIARVLCGVEYPRAVHACGGRYTSTGAAETPDTQVVTYEFDDLIMTFELALYPDYMIKADSVVRDSDLFPYWPQNGDRIELYGEKGLMYTGPVGSGWQVFERQQNREPVVTAQCFGRYPDLDHQDNFISCMRTRNLPNADIRTGHLSTLLAQFGNISYRLGGQQLRIDPQTESFTNSPEANAMLKREYRKPWVIEDAV
ncbi:MAG: Gfo/Idh/MocA family protein [Pirellulaceae bacterium]